MYDDSLWREEAAGAITTEEELSAFIDLSPAEREGIRRAGSVFKWRITPYYAGLMDPKDPACPIRRQAIPSVEELADPAGISDPIGEEAGTVAPNLIRLYPDRVAWCVTSSCPSICRFCFRRRIVGREDGDFSEETLEQAVRYVTDTPQIRDVLVTGGDPLFFSDEKLNRILTTLRRIPHVEILRIGTRAPVTLPQRITPALCRMLASHHPLWLNTHFNHPRELTPKAMGALSQLADSGIPLGNQSVLLSGVNDDPEVMRRLVHGLVKARVRPYYLFQCHLSLGTAHFRTPIESGLRIVSALRGATTGFAVPLYVADTPHGKVPLSPQTITRRSRRAVWLKCPDGAVWREENPKG